MIRNVHNFAQRYYFLFIYANIIAIFCYFFIQRHLIARGKGIYKSTTLTTKSKNIPLANTARGKGNSIADIILKHRASALKPPAG